MSGDQIGVQDVAAMMREMQATMVPVLAATGALANLADSFAEAAVATTQLRPMLVRAAPAIHLRLRAGRRRFGGAGRRGKVAERMR